MGGEIMNVYEKLVEIKKNIKGFNKDTKGFGFEYVSGSQVLRSVRDKMNELGVLLIPSVDYDTMSWEKHEYVTKKGEKKLDFIVTMKMNYTWVNAEDPNDKIVIPWVCMGQQTDDISKAVGTAMTYNERYFLLKFLGLPTDEDDADAKGANIKPNMKPTGVTEAQLKRLFAIGNKAGVKKDIVEGTVRKIFSCEAKDMTKEQYDNICERLEKKAGGK